MNDTTNHSMSGDMTPQEREQFNKLWAKTGLPELNHLHFSYNHITMATWNADDVPHFESVKIRALEKLWGEIAETERNTTVNPLQAEYKNNLASIVAQPIDTEKKFNILTLVGMKDMAQNRTNESSNTTQRSNVGTGTATELESDTGLGTQVGIKNWTDLVTVNQTEKYASSFIYSDVGSVDRDITEAGGKTEVGDDLQVFRVTFGVKEMRTGVILTFQASVVHQNGVVI